MPDPAPQSQRKRLIGTKSSAKICRSVTVRGTPPNYQQLPPIRISSTTSQCNTSPVCIVDMGQTNQTLMATHSAPEQVKEYLIAPTLTTQVGCVLAKVVTFRHYHKLNIDKFRSDLLTIPFVSSPSDDIDLLHEQYMSGLSSLLDIHAPVKTKQLIKPAPSWITDEYRTAKCMRRQFERAWRRDKSPENRSRL